MTLSEWYENISGTKSFETLITAALIEAGDDPSRYFKVCKTGLKLANAKTDDTRILLLNHANGKVQALAEAYAAMRSWPLHIARVRRIQNQAKANNGLLSVPLRYCGAHTRRWAGAEALNLQNLGSRGHPLISAIRNMLIAPAGMMLFIADASQIEARVLAWIAGQTDLCEAFIQADLHPEIPYDVYTKFASKVLGRTIRKAAKAGTPGFIEIIEKKHKWARDSIGKVGVLGCGYGMGADKAESYAKGEIDFATAKKIVDTYRAENKKIVQFWHDIERAFIYVVKYKRPQSRACGLSLHCTDDCDVIITLPNGGELKYHEVRLEEGMYGRDSARIYNSQEHKWEYTWGGSLTENIVQAMSRDILAEAMMRVEQRGHHIVFHCHDELVGCGPIDEASIGLKVSIEELSRRPVWANDCPLAAEGMLSQVYRK